MYRAGVVAHAVPLRESVQPGPVTQGAHSMPDPSLPAPPPAAALTRVLSFVVIALMLGAIIYALWMVILNWSHISV